MKVSPGSMITFHYTILDENGGVFESSKDEEPISCRFGDGDLLVGVEKALEGLEAGAARTITLEAAQAFGEYDPAGLFSVPREEIPASGKLERGEWVSIVVEPEEGDDETLTREEHEVRIVSVDDSEVILDANHPLAGKPVTFQLELLEVRAGDGRED